MRHHQLGFEPEAEVDGLLQRFVAVGTAIKTYEQACEHNW
jgi:hypothetical protein